jgi:hypothetical protein
VKVFLFRLSRLTAWFFHWLRGVMLLTHHYEYLSGYDDDDSTRFGKSPLNDLIFPFKMFSKIENALNSFFECFIVPPSSLECQRFKCLALEMRRVKRVEINCLLIESAIKRTRVGSEGKTLLIFHGNGEECSFQML